VLSDRSPLDSDQVLDLSEKSCVVCVVGLPGAGKTTVASALASALDTTALSLGQMLRAIAETDVQLASTLNAGLLGPESIVARFVEEFVQARRVAILDGYPRHRGQAEKVLTFDQRTLVVSLEVDPQLAAARSQQRALRGDEAASESRIARDAVGLKEVLQVLEPLVVACDGQRSVSEIVDQILQYARRL
jgi:adenylate kinase family enzyme